MLLHRIHNEKVPHVRFKLELRGVDKTYNYRQVRSLMISIDEQNTEVNIKLEETNLNPKYSSE